MENKSTITQLINESISVKSNLLHDNILIEKIDEVSKLIIGAFNLGKKVLFCGNGGSAADAQHIAAELSGRFNYDRPPLYSEALHVNTSYLTAVANDYSYDYVYQRLIECMGDEGDILIGISTSGNSSNIVNAFSVAKLKGLTTIAFTGETGGKMKAICDITINIPSSCTPRIQESHILVGHIICEIVETSLFPKD